MAAPDHLPELVTTEWVSSFIGQAHQGDVFSQDARLRASAWAHWLVTSLERFQGHQERPYAGILLPGSFYDPRGTGPKVRPHLEIPARLLDRPDRWAPQRLALAGNGLLFNRWLVSEVVAVRRCVMQAAPVGTPEDLSAALQGFATALRTSVSSMTGQMGAVFEDVESILVSDPGLICPEVTGPFSTAEICDFFPPAEQLGLRVDFDAKLRESSGPWAARRLGAWTVTGAPHGAHPFSLGCVTPRITRGSIALDPLFRPEREGLLALLVRGLVLRRLLGRMTGTSSGSLLPDPREADEPRHYLRSIAAKVGAKIPEASTSAAVGYLHAYPTASAAWDALAAWAADDYLLTVSAQAHSASHANARRYLLRAETPEREDVNVILPLAWHRSGKVVRVTFSKGSSSGDPGSEQ